MGRRLRKRELKKLFAEIEKGLRAGAYVDIEDYTYNHPESADELRSHYNDLLELLGRTGDDQVGDDESRPIGGVMGAAKATMQVDPRAPHAPAGDATAAYSVEPAIGRMMGEFKILREIGRGGMGIVYLAEQEGLHREVALKVLPGAFAMGERQVRRFLREAEVAAQMHHPNIVPVYSIGEEDGTYFFAMDYIEGVTFDRILARLRGVALGDQSVDTEISRLIHASRDDMSGSYERKKARRRKGARDDDTKQRALLEQSEISMEVLFDANLFSNYVRNVTRLFVKVADALQYAHDKGVIHRDIKPGNLILDSKGVPKVLDFGLARHESGGTITRTGDFIGTPIYMSPEQVLGKTAGIDRRTDVYSLGVTFYEMLTVSTPYRGRTTQELVRAITLKEPIPPRKLNPLLPKDLQTVMLKCIAKDPDHRYQSAADVRSDLDRFLNHQTIEARPPSPITQLLQRVKRRKMAASIIATITTLAASLVGYVAYKSHEDTKQSEALFAQNFGEARNQLQMAAPDQDLPETTVNTIEARVQVMRQVDPAHAQVSFLEGWSSLLQGEPGQAADLLWVALNGSMPSPSGSRDDPKRLAAARDLETQSSDRLDTVDRPRARALLARAERESGHPQVAVVLLDSLVKTESLAGDLRFQLGLALKASGDTDRALVELGRALQANMLRTPEGKVLYETGRIHFDRGDLDSALRAFESGSKARPAPVDLHRMIGKIHEIRGRQADMLAARADYLDALGDAAGAKAAADQRDARREFENTYQELETALRTGEASIPALLASAAFHLADANSALGRKKLDEIEAQLPALPEANELRAWSHLLEAGGDLEQGALAADSAMADGGEDARFTAVRLFVAWAAGDEHTDLWVEDLRREPAYEEILRAGDGWIPAADMRIPSIVRDAFQSRWLVGKGHDMVIRNAEGRIRDRLVRQAEAARKVKDWDLAKGRLDTADAFPWRDRTIVGAFADLRNQVLRDQGAEWMADLNALVKRAEEVLDRAAPNAASRTRDILDQVADMIPAAPGTSYRSSGLAESNRILKRVTDMEQAEHVGVFGSAFASATVEDRFDGLATEADRRTRSRLVRDAYGNALDLADGSGITEADDPRVAQARQRIQELDDWLTTDQRALDVFRARRSTVTRGMVRQQAGTYPYQGRPIQLSAFALDRTEVTNAQFAEFVDSGGYADRRWWEEHGGWNLVSRFTDSTGRPGPRGWRDGALIPGREDYPVTHVSWYEAWAYAMWRGVHLATDQEWEAAARGTEGRNYPWGSTWEAGRANTLEYDARGLLPVSEPEGDRTPEGMAGMLGNAQEWVGDDPVGAQAFVRGRNYASEAEPGPSDQERDLRAREAYAPEQRRKSIGFRCAVTMDEANRRLQ